MFVEQIIELLVGPARWVVYTILKLVIFLTKQRSSRKICECIVYYLLLKIFQEAMYFASLHLDEVNYKTYPKIASY